MSTTMENDQPGKFRRFLRIFVGSRGEDSTRQGNGDGDKSPDAQLYERLSREAESGISGVREIKVSKTPELADQLIALMFELKAERSGFQVKLPDLRSMLNDEAERAREDNTPLVLSCRWRVFYTYFNRGDTPFNRHDVARAFFDRLYELAGRNTRPGASVRNTGNSQMIAMAVCEFITKFIDSGVERLVHPIGAFNPDDDHHRMGFETAFGTNFAFCQKTFPRKGTQFIVGRTSPYDLREIAKKEYRLRQEWIENNPNAGAPDESTLGTKISIARRFRYPRSQGAKVRFNAHRFRTKEDQQPRAELELLISDLSSNYDLTAGSAEHDDIRCPDWDGSQKIELTRIQRGSVQWEGEQSPKKFPEWMNSVEGRPMSGLHIPLLPKIRAEQAQPKVRLISRVLPKTGTFDTMDQALQTATAALNINAALKVTEELWLVLAANEKPHRVVKTGATWIASELSEGERFDVNGCRYYWKSADKDVDFRQFTDKFAGLLVIEPAARDKIRYERDLAIDKEAEPVPVANDDIFIPRHTVNDPSLGSKGVVLIKCVEDTDDRGKYAFMPQMDGVDDAVNSFFAVKRVVPNDIQPWPEGQGWIVFDSTDKLLKENRDAEGFLAFNKERIVAVRSSYLLFCGSYIFQIEISGTPIIGPVNRMRTTPAMLVSGLEEMSEMIDAPPFEPEVAANEETIIIALRDTEFRAYTPREIGNSDISVHYELEMEGRDSVFLKAFWPSCRDNAVRETGFYEMYQERAAQLFIKPPLMVLPNSDSTLPFLIIFEKVEERAFSLIRTVEVPEAVALGYSMAVLHKAMSDDGMVNYDIDATNVCFENNGRICLIDFDNVFPTVNTRSRLLDNLSTLGGLLRASQLPAKNVLQPPEALEFNGSDGSGKEEVLLKIGPAYGIYLIGVTLLTVMQALRETKGTPAISDTKFNRKFTEDYKHAGKKLKALLKEMIRSGPSARPQPGDVVERMADIISDLAKDEGYRSQMEKRLGEEVVKELTS